ncbi:MAG: cobalamin-binding protein [Candidatus Syntrophonatronum acetioxidans]|uniref:Cobalamin-binding protein n=1 Tax=Candidatus Syntrophonatronum acetioxidans TaxID=1795816 RepID=A0A424YD52_9FIRM|nr:MAG: cobalamin-binding protein [Candidatus Syntrophonatronum acetioxidans]
MSEGLLEKLKENVLQGRMEKEDEGIDEGYEGQPGVKELTEEALEKGISTADILEAINEGMVLVGKKFEKSEYFIPDMLAASEAVGAAMEVLEPHMLKNKEQSKGKVIMATVEGDIHDIGKNLVTIMLKGAGYQVKDLGTSVSSERIIEEVEKEKPQVVGFSALLDTTMAEMGKNIEALKEKGLRDNVKVMIGGAPTSDSFAQKIGADGYGKDAFAAVELVKKLLS